jgi:hypothetical protein
MGVLRILSGVTMCTNGNDLYYSDVYKGADVFLPVVCELSLIDFSFAGGCVCVCTISQLYDVDLSYDEDCLPCVGNSLILTTS